jgi:hypothetical protein
MILICWNFSYLSEQGIEKRGHTATDQITAEQTRPE